MGGVTRKNMWTHGSEIMMVSRQKTTQSILPDPDSLCSISEELIFNAISGSIAWNLWLTKSTLAALVG